VALRLLLEPEERYEPLSHALVTSTSAVHRSVGRLRLARICKPESRTIDRDAFLEFAIGGVPYTFPCMRTGSGRGMATGTSHPGLAASSGEDSGTFVWASSRHEVEGHVIVPLFPGVVQVAERDERLYQLLSIVEAIRIAPREERLPFRESLAEALSATV
jgi:hypothetical protein